MGVPSIGILNGTLTVTSQVYGSTGSPVNADALPTYNVYEDETGTAIVSGTMALLDEVGTTGFYSEQLSLTEALGYENGKSYSVRVEALVSGTALAKRYSFICLGQEAVSVSSGAGLTTTVNVKNYLGITSSDDDTLIGVLINRATSAIEKFCGRTFSETDYREYYNGDGNSELLLGNYPVTKINLLGINRQDAFMIRNTSSDAYNAHISINETAMRLVVNGGDNEDDTSLTLASYATITALIAAIEALDKGWGTISPDTALGVWSPTELLPTGKGLSCLNEYASPQIPDEAAEDFTTDTESGILKLFGKFPRGFQNITVSYSAGYTTIPAALEQIAIDYVQMMYSSRDLNPILESEKIGDYSYKRTLAAVNGVPTSIASRLRPWRRRI